MQHIHRLKDKNHTIISTYAKRAFDKIQHPFMVKAQKTLGIEGMFHYIIKAILNGVKANPISLKSGKDKVVHSPPCYSISF
jgi:hypothetical protein